MRNGTKPIAVESLEGPPRGLSPCSAVSYETKGQHATSCGVTNSEYMQGNTTWESDSSGIVSGNPSIGRRHKALGRTTLAVHVALAGLSNGPQHAPRSTSR